MCKISGLTIASAQALIMREDLAKRAHGPSRQALVIFSFTCVGPNVRLWLTYRSLVSTRTTFEGSYAANNLIEERFSAYALYLGDLARACMGCFRFA